MTEDGLLIEYSFSNYAWGNTYYGKVILNSGDIYLFDCGEDGEKASNDCLVKKVGTVEEADLFTLKSTGSLYNNCYCINSTCIRNSCSAALR